MNPLGSTAPPLHHQASRLSEEDEVAAAIAAVAAAQRNTPVPHTAPFQSSAAFPESAEFQFRYGSAYANNSLQVEAHETAAVVGAAAAANAESVWATEVGQSGQPYRTAEPLSWQNT